MADFEAQILRFEQARQRGDFGPIAPWLGAVSAPERARLLTELICIDLELGWRRWPDRTPTPLAEYVAESPAWGGLDDLPIEIIAEAYRARSLWGDQPTHAAFLAQFGARQEEIKAELTRIDAEIAAERAEPRSDPPSAAPMLSPGLLSDRDFRLHRMIGAGRMGKVYAATPLAGGDAAVAVKFLRRALLAHPEVVRRFRAEAATIARLDHPGIVRTSGLGQTRAGSYFIVMERVAGPNLAEVARSRPILVREAVQWASATCAALAHAHARGVIHCDLKPANLLLDESGQVRVTDFGLARTLGSGPAEFPAIEGTAPFMAPEQVSPVWGPIDARTDVYGVGAVLFTLLTGRPPLVGRRLPDILAQVVSPIPIVALAHLRPDLPAALDDLVRRCLARSPAARFESVGAVRLALAAISRTSV